MFTMGIAILLMPASICSMNGLNTCVGSKQKILVGIAFFTRSLSLNIGLTQVFAPRVRDRTGRLKRNRAAMAYCNGIEKVADKQLLGRCADAIRKMIVDM